ncbi:cobalt-precorrin-5B (C(1))-methyltransferase [Zavarzinia compransoris]|uniref:Cobalt-precorrin-5B C(1)-methyltransferase n=1 Tax=Zavarzinia compransoris TaxID=1264899 RepID=A0A317E0F0_9PROT|nr:cobalt-precorrin-5B (C(1))-methyltransferase [Zavarzinia compransoris]PWR19606.1 cobalt-precorrin-5B (C(1))-methyltransferase [Zavarzinia compransoris]TDP40409.1 cobalt-precorrin-5B (C1)-methyltransferase [Zavarzinia compransoris]
MSDADLPPKDNLRYGWTTGACAAAAAKAAFTALVTGDFPDPVTITLPKGQQPAFALAVTGLAPGRAEAGIVKDAGDDPDVTHGALVRAAVTPGPAGAGVLYRAGPGVGMVTRAGLPVPPGEPAINPMPRAMIARAVADVAAATGAAGDVIVEVSVDGGAELARKTLNPRLGIVGGISILGTTGIVVPFSCSAWIHSIHRGIDVARAAGLGHVAGATGSTSEAAVAALLGLPEIALIDMGDFVGGMLKYLRRHPVSRVTVAGGFAKMTKLAQGLLDLHSRRGALDLGFLAGLAGDPGLADCNTALEALQRCEARGLDIAALVARRAQAVAAATVEGTGIAVEVIVFDRAGRLLARHG